MIGTATSPGTSNNRIMKTNYVLIDYENVQPQMVGLLAPETFRVLVFVGASQTKISFELADVLARKANGSRFIKVTGNGSNALDFHIAYQIGRLAVQEPEAYFHVISKDKGFDPLIEHLKGQGLHASRSMTVPDIEIVKKPSASMPEDEMLSTVIEYLVRRGVQRPASLKTLTGSISALFQPKLEASVAQTLMDKLELTGVFVRDGAKLKYGLPE